MKTIHKKNTTFLNLAATALMVAALVLGCKQNVNNGGEVQPPTPPVYTPVSYDNLSDHLTKTQPASDGIYYIEVTGLTESDVKGDYDSASPLGQILNSNRRKKVALKFGTMPNVTYMSSCFNGCTSLVQVSDIPEGVAYMSNCFSGCTSLTSVPNIPDGVKRMERCFSGCTSLTSVPNIPDGVKNMIGCFYGCTKLERVPNLPNSVTYMASCFYGCIKLEHVPNIPNSVTDMRWCFFGCTSLTSVTLKCEYLDGRFGDAFSGCSGLSAGRIKVPADSLDDYKDNADKMDAQKDWFAKDE